MRNVGSILSFKVLSLPLFPQGNKPDARDAEWGTLIKLYEYQIPRSGHILFKDGLLYRLDLLLPEVALPIRLHECRKGYKGHKGSFATNLSGLRTRLEEDKIKHPTYVLEDSIAASKGPVSSRAWVSSIC